MAAPDLTSLLCVLPIILTLSLASAQQGDGGAASGNLPATDANGDVLGAAGPSTGSFQLSTGATAAIAVVVSIVVILGVSTAVLFYLAKKRQWDMKEKLRNSRRRVASGVRKVMSPLTPGRATFSPGPVKTRFSMKETKGLRGPSPLRRGEKNPGIGFDMDMVALNGGDRGHELDLEKGSKTRVVVVSDKRKNYGKPSIKVPGRGEKIVEESPKTPMLNRMFGRD